MSDRIYRLLRNNKEEGPLTAEELVSKQLRTYDLIWINGRSAGWSYPGELSEFKKYAPLPGEENAETKNNKQPVATVSASVHAAVAMNNNIAPLYQKPRYKVSAAWTKIQTAPSPAVTSNNVIKIKEPMVKASAQNQSSLMQSKSLSWEEAWLDWEKEKDSNEPDFKSTPGKKVNPSRSKKVIAKNIQSTEVNYGEAPALLKENYNNDSVQQRSRSKKSPAQKNIAEFILPAAALIIIFSIGFWLLHNTSYTEKPVAPIVHQPQPVVHLNNTADNNTQTPETVSNITAKQDEQPAENSLNDEEHATDRNQKISNIKVPVQHNAAVAQQNKTAQVFTPNTKQQTDKPVNKAQPGNNKTSSPSSNASSKITDTINNVSVNTPVTNTPASNTVLPAINNIKTTDDYVSVPSSVTINNGNGDIKIQNVSDINLDLVVVNVQYFTAAGTFHKGETLYLHNLRAGKNVIIKTAKDDTSAYAVCNVSLVSADAEKLYIVSDN
jgi:hypothetical protein